MTDKIKVIHKKPHKKFKKADFSGHIALGEKIILMRSLAILFKTTASLNKAFDIVIQQTQNMRLKSVLFKIHDMISNYGYTISKAFSLFPEAFPPVYTSLIRVGEETGTLHFTFEKITEMMEWQDNLNRRFKSSLIYPVFVCGVSFLAIFLITSFVLPNILPLVVSLNKNIPWPTKVLLFCNKCIPYSMILLLACVLMFLLFTLFKKYFDMSKIYYAIDKLKLSVPFIKKLYNNLLVCEFCKNFALMHKGGVPLIKAMDIISTAIDNRIYREKIDSMGKNLSDGEHLSEALRRTFFFPTLLVQFTRVGEETGNMDSIYNSLVGYYEYETESSIRIFLDLIEPVMMILLGLIVGFILVGVLLPMQV